MRLVTCGLGRLSLALVVGRVTVLRQQAADNLQETDKLDKCTEWGHSGLDNGRQHRGRSCRGGRLHMIILIWFLSCRGNQVFHDVNERAPDIHGTRLHSLEVTKLVSFDDVDRTSLHDTQIWTYLHTHTHSRTLALENPISY